mmetsp:Transcript_52893/g.121408  ORF Transcript_52893/g.121408 Transcript_52893/m.121408 type:complete len:530 (-) Transcript_52893:415-2004(-)
MSTWSPAQLGCGNDPTKWSSANCSKRFALTALGGNGKGEVRPRKELFYFGGSRSPYKPDMLELHGPDPRAGTTLASLPALWLWQETSRRLRVARRQHLVQTGKHQPWAETHGQQMDRVRDMCSTPTLPKACTSASSSTPSAAKAVSLLDPERAAHKEAECTKRKLRCSTHGVGGMRARLKQLPRAGPNYCVHPACYRVARGVPSSWSPWCEWTKDLSEPLNRSDAFCIVSALPWATAGELNLTVVDFTPNYLCDADAMARIHRSASSPAKLRFIVVMRDPIMRAYSEWSMFSLGWGWEKIKNFTGAVSERVRRLSECNRTLWQNVDALRTLPTTELASYLRTCFLRGKAMMYVASSMYAVCIIHALRYFERHQFLFLRYEDLMQMRPDHLIRLVGRFTGLHVDQAVLDVASKSGQCDPSAIKAGAKRRMNSYSSRSAFASEMLAQASPHLERLFASFNNLLTELIHPSFRWHNAEHRLRPLSAADKAAHLLKEADEKQNAHKKWERRHQLELELKAKSKLWRKGEVKAR